MLFGAPTQEMKLSHNMEYIQSGSFPQRRSALASALADEGKLVRISFFGGIQSARKLLCGTCVLLPEGNREPA